MSATQRGGIGADVPEEIHGEVDPAPDVPHGTRDASPPERHPEPDPMMVPPWAQQAVDRVAHAEQRLAQMEGWSAQASQSFNVLAARIDVIRKQQDINSQRALALDFAIKAAPTQKGKPIVEIARQFLAFLGEGNPQMVEPVADGVDHGAEAQTTH